MKGRKCKNTKIHIQENVKIKWFPPPPPPGCPRCIDYWTDALTHNITLCLKYVLHLTSIDYLLEYILISILFIFGGSTLAPRTFAPTYFGTFAPTYFGTFAPTYFGTFAPTYFGTFAPTFYKKWKCSVIKNNAICVTLPPHIHTFWGHIWQYIVRKEKNVSNVTMHSL